MVRPSPVRPDAAIAYTYLLDHSCQIGGTTVTRRVGGGPNHSNMSTKDEGSRKRKAAEISAGKAPDDAVASANSLPHLPATCLASMLNFMLFSDVRSCVLAGKAMAVHAAKHVEVLTIDTADGMYLPAIRRFSNAKSVKIICLLEDGQEDYSFRLNPAVAAAVTPVLASFPKIRTAFIGGFISSENSGFLVFRDYTPLTSSCDGPDDHEMVFRSLLISLAGAYKSGAIPRNLKIGGIDMERSINCRNPQQEDEEEGDVPLLCSTCAMYFKNFPLEDLVLLNCWCFFGIDRLCYNNRSLICEAIKARPGGKECIASKESAIILLRSLADVMERDRGICCHFPEYMIAGLEELVAGGYSFEQITYDDVVEIIPELGRPRETKVPEGKPQKFKCYWWGSLDHLERLIALGLPIDLDWFIISRTSKPRWAH